MDKQNAPAATRARATNVGAARHSQYTTLVSPSAGELHTYRTLAEQHLQALFGHDLPAGDFIELRCLDCRVEPAKPGPRAYFRSIRECADAAMRQRGAWDVFIGVGYRRCVASLDIKQCPHAERGADHISRLPAAWVDLDVQCDDEPDKPHASLDAVLDLLATTTPVPDIIVGSGMGAHPYWLLPEPSPDLERVAAINRAIRDRLRGDNAVDPARILRLAGTLNYKHGRPLPVRLLRCPDA